MSIPGGLFEIASGVLLIAKRFPVGRAETPKGLAASPAHHDSTAARARGPVAVRSAQLSARCR